MTKRLHHPVVKHVFSFVREMSGRDGLRIVQSIGDGATDENIQKKTKLKISEVRALLNNLHSYGIVEYTREKNLNSGWFTYTWKFNLHRSMHNLLLVRKKEYERLLDLLRKGDAAQVYSCRKRCTRIAFEDAMEAGFKCERCEGAMRYSDPLVDQQKLQERVDALRGLLNQKTELLAYAMQNNETTHGQA